MKKIARNLFALGLIATAFTACDDAKNDVIDNMVYISEAATEPSTEIILGQAGEKTTTKVNVRMAQKAAVDTKVTLALDESVLTDYNKRNETEFQPMPAQYVEFPTEVVIPAGSTQAEVEVTITSFEGEAGVDYATPMRVTSASGVEVAPTSSKFIILFGKILVQKCPKFFYDSKFQIPFAATETLDSYTLEWWVRVVNRQGNGGFSTNNQAIFNFQANYELYIRFGDLTYGGSDGRAGKHEFLQIKTMGIDANYDSGDPKDESKKLPWGEWIHFAHSYDNATGDVILYKNGIEVNRANGGAGKPLELTGVQMCSSGSNYFRDYMEFAQVRLWKTCRTAAQIQKYMKKEVKYTDPNLVFYLPMNEGSGSTLHDVTGNGHDATIGDLGGNSEAYAWTEYTFE
ncbi:MAG: DUF1735 and LamG domain-containing protein [Bacteroides sp.]|nr:DUF1735 and LamG domain-containing protein [Bacteroides sp.]MCM1413858.1 DUF1735 and LamG domain-containing protein [Bacteroides sp.]MCM1471033.1 DUF1735 and LamG domain-containing protein [Bacteroides sp.]